MKWDLKVIQVIEKTKLERFLALGWEPFAVTKNEAGVEIIWLKKQE